MSRDITHSLLGAWRWQFRGCGTKRSLWTSPFLPVQTGDHLYLISQKYNLTTNDILTVNTGLTSTSTLTLGQASRAAARRTAGIERQRHRARAVARVVIHAQPGVCNARSWPPTFAHRCTPALLSFLSAGGQDSSLARDRVLLRQLHPAGCHHHHHQ